MVVIGVNTAESRGNDPVRKAREFKDKHGLTYPILVDADGKVRASFNVSAFPTNVLIDREGKVRYIAAGFNASGLESTLRELMSP